MENTSSKLGPRYYIAQSYYSVHGSERFQCQKDSLLNVEMTTLAGISRRIKLECHIAVP